ncbi:unnamed protein product [Closterium sp. Yama58-4]|nr:unnamed protein product [Closterium sp. Yama58-4]
MRASCNGAGLQAVLSEVSRGEGEFAAHPAVQYAEPRTVIPGPCSLNELDGNSLTSSDCSLEPSYALNLILPHVWSQSALHSRRIRDHIHANCSSSRASRVLDNKSNARGENSLPMGSTASAALGFLQRDCDRRMQCSQCKEGGADASLLDEGMNGISHTLETEALHYQQEATSVSATRHPLIIAIERTGKEDPKAGGEGLKWDKDVGKGLQKKEERGNRNVPYLGLLMSPSSNESHSQEEEFVRTARQVLYSIRCHGLDNDFPVVDQSSIVDCATRHSSNKAPIISEQRHPPSMTLRLSQPAILLRSPLLPLLLSSLLASLTTLSARAGSVSDDEAALIAFKQAIHVDHLNVLESWTSDRPICSWEGVTCRSAAPQRVIGLTISQGFLEGSLTPEISKLDQLRRLHLDGGMLMGNIPPQVAQLRWLTSVDLSSNHLTGEIPPNFSLLSNLHNLALRSNNISGSIPPEIFRLPKLETLALDINNLTGGLPDGPGSYSPSLVSLSVGVNYLSGPIPKALGDLPNLVQLDLHQNSFSGPIPPELGALGKLEYLDISSNQLTGGIPHALAGLSSLQAGIFSNNLLSGVVSQPFLAGVASTIDVLDVGRNTFTGSISRFATLTNAVYIELSSNKFVGGITKAFGAMPNLQQLGLSDNELTGGIPASITESSSLVVFSADRNKLIGSIPPFRCTNTGFMALTVSGNSFHGGIPRSLASCNSSLYVLDVSHNNLSGPIPLFLAELVELRNLSLGYNNFSGGIPYKLGFLDNLVSLDLSWNHLEGPLNALLPLKPLDDLQLAGNNLTGQIPYAYRLFPKASFQPGNPGLCGGPLPNRCPPRVVD